MENIAHDLLTYLYYISVKQLQSYIPATTVSARWRRTNTCSMSPTSVHACKLRTLFRKIAMNTLHISAWKRKRNGRERKISHLHWKHLDSIENCLLTENGNVLNRLHCSEYILITSREWGERKRKTISQEKGRLQWNGRWSESLSHFSKEYSLNGCNFSAFFLSAI